MGSSSLPEHLTAVDLPGRVPLPHVRCQRCADVLAHYEDGEKPPTKAKWCPDRCEPSRVNAKPYKVSRMGRGLQIHRSLQHGLPDDEYLALRARGKCDACGTAEPGHKNGFVIDHDHLCCPGTKGCPDCVRGLLCHGCNIALGGVKDDANRLLDLYAYLYRDRAKLDSKV